MQRTFPNATAAALFVEYWENYSRSNFLVRKGKTVFYEIRDTPLSTFHARERELNRIADVFIYAAERASEILANAVGSDDYLNEP